MVILGFFDILLLMERESLLSLEVRLGPTQKTGGKERKMGYLVDFY